MELDDLKSIIEEATGDKDLSLEDIPPIDLYLDQIINLMNEKLKQSTEHFANRQLTKTMVNNYSKDGLITQVHGKKYSRDQVLQMLMVYSLKNTLSMGEIKRILVNLYEDTTLEAEDLSKIYNRFLEIKDLARKDLPNLIDSYSELSGLDLEREEDYLTLLLGLCSFSSYVRDIVQVMIERRYPALESEIAADAETTDKKVLKKVKKRAKIERKAEKAHAKIDRKWEKIDRKTEKKLAKVEIEEV